MQMPHSKQQTKGDNTLLHIYTYLLDELDEGVHVVDRTGKTIVYNKKMAELENMLQEDVLDKDVLDIFTFPNEGYSTLIHVLHTGNAIKNMKQTYFNIRHERISTINHTLPIRKNGEICGAVEIARDITRIEHMQKNIWKKNETRFTFADLIGNNQTFKQVVAYAKQSAKTNSSILIAGETGTGKEMIAQSIHHASPQSLGPFVSQNCAALPEDYIEAFLFGTTVGAFPGAIHRPGLLEQADGGTILLDELDTLSLPFQAKLLRAIEEQTVRRLGDTEDRHVDIRIIATIHEDPLEAIAAGRLRKDLFYRLSVVTLFLPALRDRKEDIPELTTHFIHKYNQQFGMRIHGVTEEVMTYFLNYPWPGNVRELEHTIEGAMNIASNQIEFLHLPLHLRRKVHAMTNPNLFVSFSEKPNATNDLSYAEPRDLQHQIHQYEHAYVQKVLTKNQGNISATARELGISRQSLQYRLRKWKVR